MIAGVLLALALAAAEDPDLKSVPAWTGATLPPPELSMTPPEPVAKTTLRIATFNGSLYADREGGLAERLAAGDANARKIAAVIRDRRPDILLLNEFDYDAAGRAADLFEHDYLESPSPTQEPLRYPYRFLAPVNTGVPSGMDLNRDGVAGGTGRAHGEDSYGYGEYPGQYGMLVLSRFPIDAAAVRTFQTLPWHTLPGARSPVDPATGRDWYPPEVFARLRLSSKSHWDVPVETPAGIVHVLAAHPTPPVFDGPENRNGVRNFDEVKLWAEYLSAGDKPWLCDDQGHCGGLAQDARFVILGDHNTDPVDGESLPGSIQQILEHPRVQRLPAPRSEGAVQSALADGGANVGQRGDPAEDTGIFGPKIGNLRLDYVLPSHGLRVVGSGVFWPAPGQPGAEWMGATDHHLVWVDLDL
jgi:hypothetical protein